jgi:hypothetical protein
LPFSLASYGLRVFTQDAQGKWIGEDATLFQDLMSGTVSGCGPGRPAWLSQLHEKSLPHLRSKIARTSKTQVCATLPAFSPFAKIERALLTKRTSNTELTRKLPTGYKDIGVLCK